MWLLCCVAVPPRYMDYYGGGGYGYGGGGGGGYGYDDYYCNYGGTGAGYDDYGGYEEYDFYSPMPYGMSSSRGAGRMMYHQVTYLYDWLLAFVPNVTVHRLYAVFRMVFNFLLKQNFFLLKQN